MLNKSAHIFSCKSKACGQKMDEISKHREEEQNAAINHDDEEFCVEEDKSTDIQVF